MEETSKHCVFGRHQPCSKEGIKVLSDAIERHHSSRNTPSVKGMNPTPHIHEHLRYTIMATALRTPSRITTSRLSTLR